MYDIVAWRIEMHKIFQWCSVLTRKLYFVEKEEKQLTEMHSVELELSVCQ